MILLGAVIGILIGWFWQPIWAAKIVDTVTRSWVAWINR